MADFLEKMKNGLVKGASTVADGSGKLVERSKIKARIAKLEDEKKDLYRTLGERFYALSKEPNPDGGELEALCAKLDALQKEIDEKREEDERIKNQ